MTVDTFRLKQAVTTWASQVHSQALDDMPDRMRGYAPRKTGELAESIRRHGGTTVLGDVREGRIVAEAPQGRYTDEGTHPHVIRPRKVGGVLVFEWRGQTVFARHVNHPGNRAKPWWERALRATWGPALRYAALTRRLR